MTAAGAADAGLDERWDTGLVGPPGGASVTSSDGSLDRGPDGGSDSGLDIGPETGLDTASVGAEPVLPVPAFGVDCTWLGRCGPSINR